MTDNYSPSSIPSSEGIELMRRLLDKSNTSICQHFPMEGGIVPASLFPDRLNTLRDWKLPISCGIVPVKPLVWLDKSSSWSVKIDSVK